VALRSQLVNKFAFDVFERFPFGFSDEALDYHETDKTDESVEPEGAGGAKRNIDWLKSGGS
jgi:hypothetical protein